MTRTRTWRHVRKGLITGTIVGKAGPWLDIRLATDHQLKYMSEGNQGRVDYEGEVIRVRASLLTEVDP